MIVRCSLVLGPSKDESGGKQRAFQSESFFPVFYSGLLATVKPQKFPGTLTLSGLEDFGEDAPANLERACFSSCRRFQEGTGIRPFSGRCFLSRTFLRESFLDLPRRSGTR